MPSSLQRSMKLWAGQTGLICAFYVPNSGRCALRKNTAKFEPMVKVIRKSWDASEDYYIPLTRAKELHS